MLLDQCPVSFECQLFIYLWEKWRLRHIKLLLAANTFHFRKSLTARRSIVMERLSFPECPRDIIVWRWTDFIVTIDHQNESTVISESNTVCNTKCNAPNFESLKMSNFDIYVIYFVVTDFWWPNIWDITFGIAHCIALTDYSWLILVINCKHEVCSNSNDNISRAL